MPAAYSPFRRAVVAIVVGVGLLAWFFIPSFNGSHGPKNAGMLSDQTVGMSTASRQEPLRVTSPRATIPTASNGMSKSRGRQIFPRSAGRKYRRSRTTPRTIRSRSFPASIASARKRDAVERDACGKRRAETELPPNSFVTAQSRPSSWRPLSFRLPHHLRTISACPVTLLFTDHLPLPVVARSFMSATICLLDGFTMRILPSFSLAKSSPFND